MAERENTNPDPATPFRTLQPLPAKDPIDIVREAERKHLWLYHPGSENWYSPADFMEKYGGLLGSPDHFQGLAVCRPEDGLEALRGLLKDASDELNHLTERVISYYRNRTPQSASGNQVNFPPLHAMNGAAWPYSEKAE